MEYACLLDLLDVAVNWKMNVPCGNNSVRVIALAIALVAVANVTWKMSLHVSVENMTFLLLDALRHIVLLGTVSTLPLKLEVMASPMVQWLSV